MSGRIEHLPNVGPVFVPNDVVEGDGFYVSYNDRDADLYGSDTTALVVGGMEHFYILNGNHVENYRKFMAGGLEACMGYFRANVALKSRYSES